METLVNVITIIILFSLILYWIGNKLQWELVEFISGILIIGGLIVAATAGWFIIISGTIDLLF